MSQESTALAGSGGGTSGAPDEELRKRRTKVVDLWPFSNNNLRA